MREGSDIQQKSPAGINSRALQLYGMGLNHSATGAEKVLENNPQGVIRAVLIVACDFKFITVFQFYKLELWSLKEEAFIKLAKSTERLLSSCIRGIVGPRFFRVQLLSGVRICWPLLIIFF